MKRLNHKVAIVTGGAQGLGAGIAERFLDEGAKVVLADVTDAGSFAASLEGRGPCAAFQVDVADSESVDAMVKFAQDEFGGLDILCNNAGIGGPNVELTEVSNADFERTIAINLYGTFYGCRAAGRVMREQGSGRIINIASRFAKRAAKQRAPYSASKAAIIAMTQSLALELAPYEITANCICPGTMYTPLFSQTVSEITGEEHPDEERYVAEYVSEWVPAGRLGTPADIGAMAAWLASDDASFTTGAALNLTGGEEVFF